MSSQLTHFLQSLSKPLAVEPGFGAIMARLLVGKMLRGDALTGEVLHAELGVPSRERQAASLSERQQRAASARIAVIPIVGVVAQRAHSMGASTDQIGAMVDAAVADSRVDAILFDVDSPGGTIYGVPETAAKIREAAAVKPSLAIANSLSASAGYWLAAAAGEVWTTPTGDVGSIGVYTIHQDIRGMLEAEGVKVTAIAAGKYKLEGAPWAELTPEAEAHLQAGVDEAYGWFVRDVAAFRGDSRANVRSGYGEGRVLGAAQALEAKLVDRIGTFEEAVARLSQQVQASRRGKRADTLRRRMALDTM